MASSDSLYDENGSTPVPSIIPPESEQRPVRVRSTFSSDAKKLGRHRIDEESMAREHDVRSIQNHKRQSSSQLLEDLMRHPLDPMFEDSTLTAHTITPFQRIVTQVISFLLCVVVGVAGTQIVRNLQGNSREKVRTELAAQVTSATNHAQSIENDIKQQQAQIAQLTRQARADLRTVQKLRDVNILTGQTAVRGDGVTVTLMNPMDASNQATQGRVTEGQSKGRVTDAQLQLVVALLWAGGAEAISVNDQRLGPQTAIRAAGDTILVGVSGVQSPYVVRAIGDASDLQAEVQAEGNTARMFRSQNIDMSVVHSRGLQLPAASTVVTEYARKGEG
ncbi:DUF881 domain-containing protein [Alloscardovia macacae]|uniref:DUF881 domain-containing protein n=1 Tax=Alloscardovia macacae TaxID=1160091 RepID=A0A261F5N7_9BIFI|nr:DUF881 domain-containing protein [Alloscardovia macacae]OZG54440.1 hypothetical protein ALMA_0901 [Alloscardovia macacae]